MRSAKPSPLTIFALACLGTIACNSRRVDVIHEDPAFVRRAPSSAKIVDPESRLADEHEQFQSSSKLLEAVVSADLRAARSESIWLARPQEYHELRPWAAQVANLQARARQGFWLKDIGTASRVIANIGVACGECHSAAMHTPSFATIPMPDPGSNYKTRLRLHQWAAGRMWEGLVAPSDQLWNQGAAALAIAPLHSDAIRRSSAAPPPIVVQARTVRDLGNEGIKATSAAARAQVFARYLEHCASCHREAGLCPCRLSPVSLAAERPPPAHSAGSE